jgi:hypothetical protein
MGMKSRLTRRTHSSIPAVGIWVVIIVLNTSSVLWLQITHAGRLNIDQALRDRMVLGGLARTSTVCRHVVYDV